ncbi:hypothetical protein HanRHA438_Chr14g0654711 [Helianthus annuus]|nr:hypothetical protein HanRHA438_Chr14g0654711 [Helianthus annuus]
MPRAHLQSDTSVGNIYIKLNNEKKLREYDLVPNNWMNKALEGFLGWTAAVLSIFPVSLSSAQADESFVATTKTLFSNPCKLHIPNCREMTAVDSSLAICLSYNKVGPAVSITETCVKSLLL